MSKVDPVSWLTPALGFTGGVLNNIVNRSNMRKQVEMSKELMDYQWDKYGSPSAQVNAYKQAGINPAVAFGQSGPGQISGPSVNMPTSVPASFDLSGFAQGVQSLALAKQAGADTLKSQIENKLLEATFDEKVKEVGLRNKWTDEQTAKVTHEINLMQGQCQELQEKINSLRKNNQLTDKEISWYDRHMSAEINHLKSSADYQNALKGLTDSQKELLDGTLEDLKDITHNQALQLEKVVELLGKYGDAQTIVGMLSQVVGSASDLIGAFYKPVQVAKKIVKVE